ncbi:MAG: endopeptidase La [Chloroflexota bacterium]
MQNRPSPEYQAGEGACESGVPDILPVIPTSEAVVYPRLAITMSVSEESAVGAVDYAVAHGRVAAVFAVVNPDQPWNAENLFNIGTAAAITRLARSLDGRVEVTLEGCVRIRRRELLQTHPFPMARIEPLLETWEETVELAALQNNVVDSFKRAVSLSPSLPESAAAAADRMREPGRLSDYVASLLGLGLMERQDLLETLDVAERLRKLNALAIRELDILETGQRIQERMRAAIDRSQREYFLREQLKAIRQELGETDERAAEIADLRRRLEEAQLPPDAWREAERELDRLARMPPASPEYNVVTTYLDWLAALPWAKSTEDNLDVEHARGILDQDHFDLERVKDRILEYLAVSKLRREVRGPILAFIGPPGVGKTSLGHSIARSLGRHFVRVSLGGIRDEAEIRGHRRTYVAALPGRIIQGIRRAGSNNPVFMLDEIDKLYASFQGDPAAALLEVLDPAQNSTFTDLYIGVPFDLSRVIFIATGNVTDTIPAALLDRMEVLQLPGYTEPEKLQIARRFLVPRQIRENGLSAEQIEITDTALSEIINSYTREAGVRNLEREIAAVCRRVARKVAEGAQSKVVVTERELLDYLGPARYRREVAEQKDEIGVATGLAWTWSGGDIMLVEASVVPGTGKLILTGQLGDVMRESAMAAVTYARSRASALGIRDDFFDRNDIHIHLPAGSIPKDGPSAGVTMATSLVSALTRHPVAKEVGMTGEITLRGRVLPVGGLREKVLAAHRAGLKTVILPTENKVDLDEVRGPAKQELNFIFVDQVDQVLSNALLPHRQKEQTEVVLTGPERAKSESRSDGR